MSSERRLRIPATTENIREAVQFVIEAAQNVGLSDDSIYHCELSLDEILNNIIEHGYTPSEDGQFIDIICQLHHDRLVIIIEDDAPPFNPLTMPDPNPKEALEERGIGGWGVYLVKQYMNQVSYTYTPNKRNRFVMEKRR